MIFYINIPIDTFETCILEEPQSALVERVEEAYTHIKGHQQKMLLSHDFLY